MPILTIHNLTVGYRTLRTTKPIARDIQADLRRGELVCMIGPNGAGKSTLLRTLAGLQKPLNGTVQLQGENIARWSQQRLARTVSIVLTERVSGGLLTGQELVALGRHPYTSWVGGFSIHDEAVVQWAMQAVGAENLAKRQVNELSDGERQKIMIARALAQEPDLLILDEPTAFLDLPRRVEIMHLLKRLAHETKRAILLSTHDLDLALRHADRIWLLNGAGELTMGAPEDLVLSGAFEATFLSEGIQFDPHTGSFKIAQVAQTTVHLVGDGLPYEWTQRALHRIGFALDENSSCQIEIEVTPELIWRHEFEGAIRKFKSVHELVQHLQAEQPNNKS